MNVFFAVFYSALVGTVLAVLLRHHRAEAAIFVSVAVGCLILYTVLPMVQETVAVFEDITTSAGLDSSWLPTVLKICGIAFIGEWGIQLCKDAGENAIATKLELGTKLTILILCIPVINQLLTMIKSIL